MSLSPTLLQIRISELDQVERGSGFLKIPHVLFELLFKLPDTKLEMQVLACLIRFTLGFRRRECHASQGFIARWTGLAAPNVRRTLRKLEAQGLIEKVSLGNQKHTPACYRIPVLEMALGSAGQPDHSTGELPLWASGDQPELRSKTLPNSGRKPPRTQFSLIPKKEKERNSKPAQASNKLPKAVASAAHGRLEAFVRAFPEEAARSEYIRQRAARYPLLNPEGVVARNLVISCWNEEEDRHES